MPAPSSPTPPTNYFTLETAPRPAGIAVFHLRGPRVAPFLQSHANLPPSSSPTPTPTPLRLRPLTTPAGHPIDEVLIAPFSPTDAELSCHGGPEIVRQIRTALLNAGFTEAPSPSLSPEDRITAALPLCRTELATRTLLAQRHAPLLPRATGQSALALHHLLHPPLIAIVGRPNVGKSTLVNALAGRPVSITADLPGTTRDHLRAEADLDGLTAILIDTPGHREPPPESTIPDLHLETEAHALAAPIIEHADLLLLVLDATTGLTPSDAAYLPRNPLIVANRIDLLTHTTLPPALNAIPISALTGQGLPTLTRSIHHRLGLPDQPETLAYELW